MVVQEEEKEEEENMNSSRYEAIVCCTRAYFLPKFLQSLELNREKSRPCSHVVVIVSLRWSRVLAVAGMIRQTRQSVGLAPRR